MDTVISGARVAPGHDGAAELVVLLRHGNGGEDRVTLDAEQAERLLDRCGVAEPAALAGHSWRHLMHVLDSTSDHGKE